MTPLKLFTYAAAIIVILEIFLELVVDGIRRRFQWLITKKKDYVPEINAHGLKKFLADGYDAELGWVRKPNTCHPETGRFGQTFWHTNDIGARFNPGHEQLPVRIACYGDSFTFCRQVNDNETWEHYLSIHTGTNVLNWGVGNHGIDQSFLRLQREHRTHPAETVIVGVVPDTISRILSIWKHYYEYGNTFGFKPRFISRDGELHLLKNPIDTADKFQRLESYLDEVKRNDYFYRNKFLKEIFSFPYLFTFLRNPVRSMQLIYFNSMASLTGTPDKYRSLAMQKIMDINLQWRLILYKNPDAIELFQSIISKLVSFANENDFRLIIALMPQKDDLIHIKKNGHFYQPFIEGVRKEALVVDLAPALLALENVDAYYSDDTVYGGHFSRIGNQLVAKVLWETLKNDGSDKLRGNFNARS